MMDAGRMRWLLWMAVLAVAARARPAEPLPGVTREAGPVVLVENHNSALSVWHARGVRGATVVHLDTHDDCRYVAPDRLEELRRLLDGGDYAAVHRRSDQEAVNAYRVSEAEQLFDLGNFLYPALAEGILAQVIWVVPDPVLVPAQRDRLILHLRAALGLPGAEPEMAGGGAFSFAVAGGRFTVTTLEALEPQAPGTLLDLDTDFFTFPYALTDRHVQGPLPRDPAAVCARLRQRVPAPAVVTVSGSTWGGYVPVLLRFLADACFEAFADGRYPPDAAGLLAAVTAMRTSGAPAPVPAVAPGSPFVAGTVYAQAMARLLAGETEEALALAETAAGLSPVYAKGLLDFSEALLRLERPGEAARAVDVFERLAGHPTTDADVARAHVCRATGRYDEAARLAARVAEWNPTPFHLVLRGGVLTEMGRLDEAAAVFARVRAAYPADPVAAYNLGLVEERRGRVDAAVDAYAAAVMLRPDFFQALDNLGHLLLRQGRAAEALPRLQAAAALNDTHPATCMNLALCLAELGRHAEALPWYDRALALRPADPVIRANRAATQRALGIRAPSGSAQPAADDDLGRR